ncbi:hypothetical protein JVT61DRAFT_3483 [Boletus reticuloceps]|uniref:Uncharacterized protein n=1 Tax=Boletus reticuloceps TaxID=495285 RepID=A0A8I2YNL5_9AGAM|nr:hypothetical protein JVT61DRAFT_3483 [Boletus reticuloceps]
MWRSSQEHLEYSCPDASGYVAAKVIHFYTKDWTLCLNLEVPNHKESPEVISEMEEATGVSAQQLMTLRPGLTSIREKLRLASTRETTLVEDAAYSLLGIFSVAGIPAIYDVSILAWTGQSGSLNSCLRAHISVFNELTMSYLPLPIPDAEMETIVTMLHTSSFDLEGALRLYDRLNELSAPWFAVSRMKLPCIAFQLPPFSQSRRARSGRIYRTDTIAFGTVDIKTRHDLSRMKSLYLVHPWLDAPIKIEFSDEEADDDDEFSEEINDNSLSLPKHGSSPHSAGSYDYGSSRQGSRSTTARCPSQTAIRGTLTHTGINGRRAADSLITVQFQENVSLADILDNVTFCNYVASRVTWNGCCRCPYYFALLNSRQAFPS